MVDCKFAHDVGDINEDGVNEHICLLKSKIDMWPGDSVLPFGGIHFIGMGECCYCPIEPRNKIAVTNNRKDEENEKVD